MYTEHVEATVTRVTRSTVMATTESGMPHGWFKRKYECLYDADVGDTLVLEETKCDGGVSLWKPIKVIQNG